MRFDDVPTGSTFSMVVEVTSRDGTTNVYAADPRRGRTWAGGVFATSSIGVDVQASMSISRTDGGPVAYRRYRLVVAGTAWAASNLSPGARYVCNPELTPIDLGEPKSVAGLTSVSRWTVEIQAVNPFDMEGSPRDCAEQLRVSDFSNAWLRTAPVNFGIEQLLSGFTQTYTEGPYVITVSMNAVP